MIQAEVDKMQKASKLKKVTPQQKAEQDGSAWQAWLKRYGARLQQEAQAGADPQQRVQAMNGTNPRSVSCRYSDCTRLVTVESIPMTMSSHAINSMIQGHTACTLG